MRASVLRDMTIEELKQKTQELKDERFNLLMRRTLKPLDNPLRLRELRRDLARIVTILSEDERGVRSLSQTRVDILKQS